MENDLLEYFEYKNGDLYRKKSNKSRAKSGELAGYLTNDGYRRVMHKGKRYLVHRLIFFIHHGYMPEFVDHKNGIKNDNRIKNLREANHAQNQQNVGISKRNKSGFKNVCWRKDINKWAVTISIDNKNRHFGFYEKLEDAAQVAKEVRSKHYKQFARHK